MSVVEALRTQRESRIADADALVANADATPDQFTEARAILTEVSDIDARIETAEAVESRKAELAKSRKEAGVGSFVAPAGTASVTVGNEPRTYDRDKRNSWAKDLVAAEGRYNLAGSDEARARLQRHHKEADVESRAGSTTATAGGEFSPPSYLLTDYAGFARAVSVASNLLTQETIGDGVSSIKIPQITTGTLTALQGGNNVAATTRDIVTGYVTSAVETAAGYNDISIQLIEQSPINMDSIIFGDLVKDLALTINTQVTSNNAGTSHTLLGLTYQGINTGTSVTWTETTPDAVGLVAALGKALSGVANSRYMDAEAIIMSPSTWYSLTALVDSSNRPVFASMAGGFNPVFTGDNLAKSSGLVGIYGAGVPVYIDATMPKTVNTNQSPILVGKFSDSYLFKGAQKAGLFPDVGSSTLTVRYRLYQYVALAHRFNKSIAAITGTGTVVPSGY